MAVSIHPSSIVHPNAQLGEGVSIGPFCTVSAGAVIGDRTILQSHVIVDGNTRIGANCKIFPLACLGMQSQDLKFKDGNVCYTEIGDNCIIRESVTVHAGTDDGTKTVIGNDCALLALSHVAHNCRVGNNVILSHSATLGGHVTVEDFANVGGLSAVHQFVRIGRHALIAGVVRVSQDIVPYTISDGTPAIMRVINAVGMKRAGYTPEQINDATRAFKTLFKRGLRLEDAIAQLREESPDSTVIANMLTFIEGSERGLARPTAD